MLMQDIFVGVLCVIAALAGIWCWWYENGESSGKGKKENSTIEKE